jgi:hypothetical protein
MQRIKCFPEIPGRYLTSRQVEQLSRMKELQANQMRNQIKGMPSLPPRALDQAADRTVRQMYVQQM